MTTTTALALNVLLMSGLAGALVAVVRLGLRLSQGERPETLHPSQPLPLLLVARADEDRDLARAA